MFTLNAKQLCPLVQNDLNSVRQNSKTFDDESHGTNERRYVTFTYIVIEQTIEMRSIDVLSKEQTRYPCECQFSLETFYHYSSSKLEWSRCWKIVVNGMF